MVHFKKKTSSKLKKIVNAKVSKAKLKKNAKSDKHKITKVKKKALSASLDKKTKGATSQKAKSPKLLITCALPYANGPLHLGFILEAVQGDIYARFNRLIGTDVLFCCADDTHGTPIEVNAEKQGISPEALIAKVYDEHAKDLKDFEISFDSFYTTNSKENQELSELFFNRLNKKGHIYQKEIELTFCNTCKRFLPDRYVKGKCPKCKTPDQYGDVCEKCNSAYNTIDLVNPYCVICKSVPIRKTSKHYFFKLSAFEKQLTKYINTNKNFQPEVVNYLKNWITEGLKDWCISRDGPYFGFKIPNEENKYFYVWLDAPIGYISSTINGCRIKGKENEGKGMGKKGIEDNGWESYWNEKSKANITHIIGKDIIYFHYLFWPAMLLAAGFKLPDDIPVHGFLTINGEKMSKSRGTFILARDYLDTAKLSHECLRFYYASNLVKSNVDIDLNTKDFQDKINNELVANIGNFAFRTLSFAHKNFDSTIVSASEPKLEKEISSKIDQIANDYQTFNFREAVHKILEISSLGNKYFQDNEPWKLIKTDKNKAHRVVSVCANLCKDLAILLNPILPKLSRTLWHQLNLSEEQLTWDALTTALITKGHKINEPALLVQKLENVNLVTQDFFSKLDLRVAKVEQVADHPNADKLYVLQLDLGSLGKRQLVAGLRQHYSKEQLAGKKIVMIANLEPAKLRGVESQGMLLAGDDGKGTVGALFVEGSGAGESVIAESLPKTPADKISFDDFINNVKITVTNGKVNYNGKKLLTEQTKEQVKVDKNLQNGTVR